jgi:hypothetical protein
MGLSLQNVLLFIDMRLAAIDLALVRMVPALIGVALLLYGLIRDGQ